MNRIAPLAVVVIALAIAVLPLLPPSPQPADAPEDRFSAERAIEHVVTIAREPHPIGSPQNVIVREYIMAELVALGLDPITQSTVVPDYYRPAGNVAVVNLMARIPGTASTAAVILMAHYDTVPSSPGANDDSAGVAAILETGRALLAGPQLQNDVILLLTDGEEPAPRFGARAFVDDHPWADDVAFVVNFDAAGGTGPSVLVETSGPNGWVAVEIVAAAPKPAVFSFYPALLDLIGAGGTDFTPFRERGIPGANFAYIHGSPIYHTEADTPPRVSLGSLQHHGSYALSIARQMGNADLTSTPVEGDAIYFAAGPFVIHYPKSWAPLVAAFAALAFGLAVIHRRIRRQLSLRSVVSGAGFVALAAVGAGLIAAGGWRLLLSVRETPGVAEAYSYLAMLLVFLLPPSLALARRFLKNHSWFELSAGIALLWLFLAITASIATPGVGYLFAWPAMAAALVLGLSWGSGLAGRLAAFSLVVFPTLILIVPAVDILYQLAMPRPGNPDSEVLFVIIFPVVLSLLSAGLVWSTWRTLGAGTGGKAQATAHPWTPRADMPPGGSQ